MIRRSKLLDLCFAGIIIIILSNLNGLATLLFGITAPFSSFILAFCLIITLYLFRYKKITLPHYAFNITLISFLVIGTMMWMFYSHIYFKEADYYIVFRKQAPGILLVYALYKYLIYTADRGKLIPALYFVTFSLLISTLVIPLSALIGDVLPGAFRAIMYGGGRSYGLFGSPNLAGIHANFTLAFVLFFLINSRRFSLLFLLLLPIVFYASFLTFSKAAIIVAGLLLIVFFLYNFGIVLKMRQARRRRFLTSITIIIITIAYFYPTIQEYTSNLQFHQLQRLTEIGGLLRGDINEETTTHRSALWAEGFELIKAQPFLGHGTSCFHHLPEGRLGIHNTYLVVWGEAGIIPFAALLVFIFCVFYRSFFWIRDPSYRFLAITIAIIITIQMYGASHNGLKNSEILCMTAVLFAIIESQRGKIDHLRYGKYVGKDYKYKVIEMFRKSGKTK